MEKEYYIYFDNKIYKLFKDDKGNTRIRLKLPTENTSNETCFILYHNKRVKKSGYFVFKKKDNLVLDEDLILSEATKKLGLVDSTTVYLLKTEVENYYIYFYITKIEIERLFLEYEFKELYPFEFFLYNSDPTNELYSILSENLFYIKQFNSYQDLEIINKLNFETNIISFEKAISYLNTTVNKKILFSGSEDILINIHDKTNQEETNNYIPWKDKPKNEEIIDKVNIMTNLHLFKINELVDQIHNKKFKSFVFQDKVSIYYKAKKLKPILLILSVIFTILSTFFLYQFINTQTINYIYSNKISELQSQIKTIEKKNKNALKQQYLQYYNPIDISLIKRTMSVITMLDTDLISSYKMDLKNKKINVELKTTALKNVQIMNNIKNSNISKIKFVSKKNKGYIIYFTYNKNKFNNRHKRKK